MISQVLEGEVGMCGSCPIMESSSPSCSASNLFAGEIGALRGLSEGTCEVALVYNSTSSLSLSLSLSVCVCVCLSKYDFKSISEVSNPE